MRNRLRVSILRFDNFNKIKRSVINIGRSMLNVRCSTFNFFIVCKLIEKTSNGYKLNG